MSVLERALRWLVIGCIFSLLFVPLIVADGQHFPYNFFFPYITGKNFAFRILVEIMAGAYLALALVNPRYRPKRSWLLGALAIFVAIIAAADIFGVNADKSIWSNYERMDGLVTLVHLLLFTSIASIMLSTERLWRALFWTSLGVSVYLSIYGLLQIAGVSTLAGGGSGSLTARIDATFGNPIYLAAYMLFHIFFATMLWVQQWVERRSGERTIISIVYGSIIALNVLTLLFTGTRGTILGLAGGAVVAAALALFQSRNSKTMWRVSIATVSVVLVLAGSIWAIRDTSLVHKIGFLGRLATISLEENTVKARFLNWSMAWQGVKERPILGWGQENYAIVFDKYYDPRMYAQEPWFDRVHNVVFDWLVAGGFLGLFAYLSILVAALSMLWKRSFSASERSILTGLLAAYFFHNFFVFDNVTSYILFGLTLAYIVYRSTVGSRHVFERPILSASALPYAALGAFLVTTIAVLTINAPAITANITLLKALSQNPEGITKNLEQFEAVIALNTFGTQEAREQLSQAATQVAAAPNVPNDVKQRFITSAITQMKAQEAASPLDARFPLFLAAIYESAGDNQGAWTALQRAHELSGKKQLIYFEMADNAMLRGDEAAMLDLYKTAYELDTEYNNARFFYAGALIRAGRETQAQTLIAPFIQSGEAADPRILSAYAARKEYLKAVPIWEAKVSATPQDAQAYFTLAALYYEGGDREGAIRTLQAAKAAVPSLAGQVDSLIQQVRSGTIQI